MKHNLKLITLFISLFISLSSCAALGGVGRERGRSTSSNSSSSFIKEDSSSLDDTGSPDITEVTYYYDFWINNLDYLELPHRYDEILYIEVGYSTNDPDVPLDDPQAAYQKGYIYFEIEDPSVCHFGDPFVIKPDKASHTYIDSYFNGIYFKTFKVDFTYHEEYYYHIDVLNIDEISKMYLGETKEIAFSIYTNDPDFYFSKDECLDQGILKFYSNMPDDLIVNRYILEARRTGYYSLYCYFAGQVMYVCDVNVISPEPEIITNKTISDILNDYNQGNIRSLDRKYLIHGYIAGHYGSDVYISNYGRYYLSDTPNMTPNDTIYVYRSSANMEITWDNDKYYYSNPKDFQMDSLTSNLFIGSEVTLECVFSIYNDEPELIGKIISAEKNHNYMYEPNDIYVFNDGLTIEQYCNKNIEYMIFPEVCDYPVYFASNDESIAVVNEYGVVVGVNPGTTEIYIGCRYLRRTIIVTVTEAIAKSEDITLDGKMNDRIWNDAIRENVAILGLHSDGSYEKFYATKDQYGVYMFADLFCPDAYINNDWWQGMNFEVQFTKNSDLSLTSGQIWFSNSGGGSNRPTNTWAMSEIDNLYGMKHVSFELFVPYIDIPGATATDTIYCTGFGANPGGLEWKQFKNGSLTITANGFAGQPTHDCSIDGHVLSGNEIIGVGSCLHESLAKTYCIWCGQEEQITIPYDGHKCFDDIPTGCSSDIVICEDCHENVTRTIVEPITSEVINDRYEEGGWNNPDTWTKCCDNITGNFIAKIQFHNSTNVQEEPQYTCWRSVMPVIYDSTNGIGDCATFRFDWYGWLEAGFDSDGSSNTLATGINTGNSWCQWDNELGTFLKDMDVLLTITRHGDEIALHYDIYPNVGGHYTYEQGLNGVKAASIGIALTCEFTKFSVSSVRYAYF